MSEEKLSPGMEQYKKIKKKYEDCILLYRMGDFYEMFFQDAITASRELDLILTAKNTGKDMDKAPMCGVPYHAIQSYIARLIANGHKVAVCEQLTEPTKGSKIVERDVVRIITPGTVIDDEMLEGQKNNYLLSVFKNGEKIGISYVDITTGQFDVALYEENLEQEVSDLIARINPSEVIGNEEAAKFYNSLAIFKLGGVKRLNAYYEWAFGLSRATDNLKTQFGDNFENVYDLKNKNHIICSAGALIEYLTETQKRAMSNINQIRLIRNQNYMTIDLNTRRNLEIVDSNRERRKFGSILWVLDKTKTSMGARCLRRMIDEPLQNSKVINERLDGVEELVKKLVLRDKLTKILSNIYDIERITGKIAYGNVNPKDLLTLKLSLQALPLIKEELSVTTSEYLKNCREELIDVKDITNLIDKAIDDNASSMMKDGGFIKKGFNQELDEYRDAKTLGDKWIKELEEKEIAQTDIKTLKVKYNKVFGFYIEVSRGQIDKVPLRYVRKQTTVNSERYITEELKAIEEKVLGAEEKALALESELFAELKRILTRYIKTFQTISLSIAKLDAILSLANVAVKNNFCKPKINGSVSQLKITNGRHPVVEQFIDNGTFVANDTLLDDDENRVMIITGPNMAGKSTYMRQVAIIVLLAHIGSFVPASEAIIPITDRIFTRVGASDDLAFGQSTFMVEMSEVATILANATKKSLIVLDEIGRGTSTFDGLSIAWSVIEYIAGKTKAKTLFATHYHELTELEGVLPGVKNFKISVQEIDDHIVFLRKIVRGGANKSFGIEVARLAGVPKEVTIRAKEISDNLEKTNQKLDTAIFKERKEKAEDNTKLALSILNIIKDIDINRISPMHAFEIINDLVDKVREKNEN